jgi:hypothetical protein
MALADMIYMAVCYSIRFPVTSNEHPNGGGGGPGG